MSVLPSLEIVEFRKIRIECHTEYYHVLDYLLLQIQFLDLQYHLQVFQGQYQFLHRVANLVTTKNERPLFSGLCFRNSFPS